MGMGGGGGGSGAEQKPGQSDALENIWKDQRPFEALFTTTHSPGVEKNSGFSCGVLGPLSLRICFQVLRQR